MPVSCAAMFRSSELVTLAEAYCTAKSVSHAALGELVMGNHKFFKLLIAGRGAHSSNLERASDWFTENWPNDVPWPQGVTAPKEAA
jgi:hypothetical protein